MSNKFLHVERNVDTFFNTISVYLQIENRRFVLLSENGWIVLQQLFKENMFIVQDDKMKAFDRE